MTLLDVYPVVKVAHMSLAGGSGAFFAVRGAAVLTGHGWPIRASWRKLSYAIDTALLAAGLTLWFMLRLNPIQDPWLGVKLALLAFYVVAGSMAMKRCCRTRIVQCASFGCAISLYLLIASVAISHRPLGPFSHLL